jgi:hypothetical protein
MPRCSSPDRRTGTTPRRRPFSSFGTTVLDQLNFNEAGQKTMVVGAAYDLSHLITDGLKVQTRYGWAWDAVDALSGAPLSRQNEFNIELEYLASGPLETSTCSVLLAGRDAQQSAGRNAATAVRIVTYPFRL